MAVEAIVQLQMVVKNLTGAVISAKIPKVLFSSNSCLTENVDFQEHRHGRQGTVDIKTHVIANKVLLVKQLALHHKTARVML